MPRTLSYFPALDSEPDFRERLARILVLEPTITEIETIGAIADNIAGKAFKYLQQQSQGPTIQVYLFYHWSADGRPFVEKTLFKKEGMVIIVALDKNGAVHIFRAD